MHIGISQMCKGTCVPVHMWSTGINLGWHSSVICPLWFLLLVCLFFYYLMSMVFYISGAHGVQQRVDRSPEKLGYRQL